MFQGQSFPSKAAAPPADKAAGFLQVITARIEAGRLGHQQPLHLSFHNNKNVDNKPEKKKSTPYNIWQHLMAIILRGCETQTGDLPSSHQALVRHLAFLCRGLSTFSRQNEMTQSTKWDSSLQSIQHLSVSAAPGYV